jgi:hypothetical protein
MDWNATPKRSTLASSFLSSSSSPSPHSTQEACFSVTGSCKRRYAHTMEEKSAESAASAASLYAGTNAGDTNSSSSNLFLDCESLQHSLKRVRLSSSPGELRLQRDLRHLVLSSRWIPVDEDLWCLQQTHSQQQQSHGDNAAGAPRTPATNSNNGVQLQRLTTATLKLTVVLPRTRIKDNQQTTAHVWLQIPRLYPHRPPVVNRIAYSQSAQDPDHSHHSAPELCMPHYDVPTKDWFPEGDTLLVEEKQQQQQQQQQDSRIQSLVFTTDEYMLTRTPTTGPTVYALWSPIQRLGDALDCIIQHLMAVNVNISHSSSPSSVEQHEHTNTTTQTCEDASVERLSRFWHEKETASCSPPEADRATEKQRPRSDTITTTNTSTCWVMVCCCNQQRTISRPTDLIRGTSATRPGPLWKLWTFPTRETLLDTIIRPTDCRYFISSNRETLVLFMYDSIY